jgi:endonuclease/exonuclease/phosphatase family metal-dependent hydrolase
LKLKTETAKRVDEPSTFNVRLANRSLFTEMGLPALTVLFGLQVLRVLVPGLTWILGDRLGLDATMLGLIALVIFLPAFLGSTLSRFLGYRWSIIITAGGLGLIRLLIQIWQGDPLVDLGLAMAGTVLFVLFLPIHLDRVRLQGQPATSYFTIGLLVGLGLDTTIHGAFSTYDTVWQTGLLPLLITVLLVLAQWLWLSFRIATRNHDNAETSGTFGRKSMVWLAIGPFLFLQLVVFQNIARLVVLTGWPLPVSFGWTLLAHIVALATAVWLLRRESTILWPIALVSGAILIAVSALPYPETWLAALALIIGQLSVTILIVAVLTGIAESRGNNGFSGITTGNGVGMLLLLVFLLGYYAVYQIKLPYTNTVLEPVAAFIIAVCALVSCIKFRKRVRVSRRLWLVPGLVIILLVLPLIDIITWQEPETVTGDGFPVRIMTYNLHNGFNTDGDLDMEALAQVIEESQPDIIALQEIARGWLVSGRLDMLTWLSQRLGMTYVFGPTADPLWGNAILSRYPIVEYSNYDLPPRNLFLLRGFTSAVIDLSGGDTIQVIVTHFHHITEDSDIRQLQSPVIIDFWGGTERTVILGDLNAEPDASEIVMLKQAGLVDVLADMEPTSVYTFNSSNPFQRIDYIWASPDLEKRDEHVLSSQASDHLPVVVVIDR